MELNFSSPDFKTITARDFNSIHSKTLYRSICVPSTTQSYSLCVEYMKRWFLSKFNPDTFKSVYTEGKNIYDDFRSLSKLDLLKRQKPALAIVPSISWDFNNENIDSYPYGISLYTQTGRFKESFFSCHETNSYMGIGLETILMNFNFKIRLETRAQQLDMFKFIKLACRVGFTNGEDVDLDFHLPYVLMIQVAKDNGFNVIEKETADGKEEYIANVSEFLRWLNMHSTLPFLYKHRTLNGRNEFFLRMRNMYVHIRPTDISADDGEREGHMTNNFTIDLNCEVRFPAPKMYAYYSNNAHQLQTIYGSWYQPNGLITTCYTFQGIEIPDKNSYDWPLFMSTTYEEDEKTNYILEIDFSELLQGDIGDCIKDSLSKGLSPALFCEFKLYNGGQYIRGNMDWETLFFRSNDRVRTPGTYIGVYVDMDYVNDFILHKSGYKERLQQSDKK